MDPAQVSAALVGLAYPARHWQLLAQADYYGADIDTRVELARLPDGLYPDLASVIAAVAAGLPDQPSTTPSPRR
jgi:hypothetical protein